LSTGSEWDSSDEETKEVVVPKAATKKAPVAGKKGAKKEVPSKDDRNEESERDATVLYIGHLPDEFEERDLRNFLQQFGKLVNIRISRSVKSGNSRGYAFVRWEDAETARIVAETLQGYLLGGRRLVCHSVPNPNKHMFYNTDKVIEQRQLKRKVDEKKRTSSLADLGKIKEITARLVMRERKKRAKLEELGIEYEFPGYEASLTRVGEDEEMDEATSKEVPKGDQQEPKKNRKESIDISASPSGSTTRKESIRSQDSIGSEVKKAKKHKKRRKSAP
jgi:nucleolar protein 15